MIDNTFVLLQIRKLLIVLQEQQIHMLITSFISMFSIKVDQPNVDGDDQKAEVGGEYVLFALMRSKVDKVVAYITDKACFQDSATSAWTRSTKKPLSRRFLRTQ